MSKDVECPYCGEWQEVCHDDGQGYEESVHHEMDCGDCNKTFTFFTEISFDYEAMKADCLNGGDHDMEKMWTTRDGEWERCNGCGEQRRKDS